MLSLSLLFVMKGLAQGIAINLDNSQPHASAMLDIKSSNKGLLIPRMSTGSRNAIAGPATGLLVYDSTLKSFFAFDGTAWVDMSSKSQLERITEAGNSGYRILNRAAANFGNTGIDAVDLSLSDTASLINGATGNYAFASGNNTSASGIGSTAMGLGSAASGFAASTMGYGNNSSGNGSFSGGQLNNAMGFYSVALGTNNVSGNGSTAIGSFNSATGSYATAMGFSSTSSGNYSTAIGYIGVASGLYSTGIGYLPTALGDFSVALGAFNTASGTSATAFGLSCTASGGYSTAMGSFSLASGSASTSIGNLTNASGQIATAIGNKAMASGDFTIAAGNGVNAKSWGEMAVGNFNDTLLQANTSAYTGDSNRVFTVGTGYENHLKTGFIVQQNGNVGIGVSTALAKLHVDGRIAITNNNALELGAGVAGKEFNAGKMIYGLIDAHVLDIIGGGTASNNRRIRLWCEAGAEFTGPIGIGRAPVNAALQLTNELVNRKIVLYATDNGNHQYLGFGVNPGYMRYQVGAPGDSHVFFAAIDSVSSKELMRITGAGNVAIGRSTATAKLHLAGNQKIDSTYSLEFGAGFTKEANAGKIAYQLFTPDALDVVGAGTLGVNRKVKIWAEGGLIISGSIEQDAVQVPTLLAGWVNNGAGYTAAGFWKDKEGMVHLHGLIKSGVSLPGTILFTLPSGYWPSGGRMIFPVIANDALGRVEITITGEVRVGTLSNNVWLNLSGISFRAN